MKLNNIILPSFELVKIVVNLINDSLKKKDILINLISDPEKKIFKKIGYGD